ncbi:MAG: response regulator [Bacteroidia bacterium]|nr:response regulator [Bacteroidia bacterium]
MHEHTPERKQILLVEDDEQSIQYVQVLLRNTWDVTATAWADEAWDILNHKGIDLVLMDLSLPGDENGLDLTMKIRKSPNHAALPIIAVTAHAFPADRVRCIEAGCNAYLSKPFERKDLIDTIRAFI